MKKLNEKDMVEAGGKVWKKGGMNRVYFNGINDVAKLFNCVVVESLSGMVPSGYDGMLKDGKCKSYYDLNKDTFFASSGDIANVARENDLKVKRV